MRLITDEWKSFYLHKLFHIQMGNGFDKNKLDEDTPEVNLVSRVSYNNGFDVKVGLVDGVTPFKAGLVTVALGGSYLGSCFVQEESFYTAQNVAVMEAVSPSMTHAVKSFITGLVRFECKTKYYAFGRELNTHIRRDFDVTLPILHNLDGTPFIDSSHEFSDNGFVPDWQFMEDYIKSLHHKPLTTKNAISKAPILDTNCWKEFVYTDIFKLKGGFYNKKPEHSIDGDIPFLASTDSNNGVTEYYSLEDIKQWDKVGEEDNTLDKKLFEGNCITVTVNGSVCNAYYQADTFTCSHDITALYLKKHRLNSYIATFLCAVIMKEKYRWSYGRKPHDVKKFGRSIIKLPVDANGNPDWQFMEDYIKALPYGDRI